MDNLDDFVNVLKTSEDATALYETADDVWTLAETNLFEADGLIGGLMRVMRKEGEEFMLAFSMR